MKKFSFNSIIRKQQPKGVFIVAIWKSGHRYLSISIVIGIGIAKNLFLPSEFFLKKQNFFFYFLCLVIVSVPLCYKYLFLYDFLFIHSIASIGVLENCYLNIWRHPSIGVLKKQLLRKFLPTLHTLQRNIQGGVILGLLQKAL